MRYAFVDILFANYRLYIAIGTPMRYTFVDNLFTNYRLYIATKTPMRYIFIDASLPIIDPIRYNIFVEFLVDFPFDKYRLRIANK